MGDCIDLEYLLSMSVFAVYGKVRTFVVSISLCIDLSPMADPTVIPSCRDVGSYFGFEWYMQ